MFESRAFAHSHRSQSFLRYIVEETLAGRAAQIKERNIGVDVFGKSENFDPQEESVVRVAAGEVRKRLLEAYQECPANDVRIELPVGSYCPKFKLESVHPPDLQEVIVSATPLRHAHLSWMRSSRKVLYACALLLCVSAFLFLPMVLRPKEPLSSLWEMFSGHKQPVLIALPAPRVAEFSSSGSLDSDRSIEKIAIDGMELRTNYYTGTGAGWGAARFAEQLALRHQQFTLRFGKEVLFDDVKQNPAILFGASTSPLGVQMTKDLRYRIVGEGNRAAIVDSGGTGTEWRESSDQAPADTREGYTLISILHNPVSGYPLMIIAGLQTSDTRAGAEFLTNNEYFRAFTQVAGKGWEKKNCQIVLQTQIYENTPGKPIITAWYVW